MTLLARSSRRWLLGHPGQAGLTVLGIALGVAVVVAIDLATHSAREAFRASSEAVAGRATHRIVAGPAGLDPALFVRLRTEIGVRAAAPLVEGWAATDRLPGTALRLLGVDPFSERPFRPWLAGGGPGVDVAALVTVPGGVVLASPTARRAGLAAGDSFALIVDGRLRSAVVVGLFEPDDELARRGLSDVVVADIATAQAFTGRGDRLTSIDLAPSEAERDAVAAVLPPDARIEEIGTRTEAMVGMLRAFDLNLTALSLLALVFGMFLVYNAATFSVVRRRELLGTFRALGVTRGEVLRLVAGEAFVTGVAGSALGLALGVLLGRGLVRLVTRTINDLWFVVAVDGLAVSSGVLLKGAVLGVGASVLAALPAVREAVSSPPRAAQTRSRIEERARRLVPRAAGVGVALALAGGGLLMVPSRSVALGFTGLAGVLLGAALLTPLATVGRVRVLTPALGRTVGILGVHAARGVTAALSRTGPAAAALVVAVAVTVGLGIMIDSFRSTLVAWLDHTLQADVYVSPPSVVASRAEGTLSAELVGRLVDAPFVAGATTYGGAELTLHDGPVRVVALDLDPRGEPAFRFSRGRADDAFGAFRERGALLVSEPFAYRRGLEPGDSVTLPTPRGPIPFAVAAVFTDYGSDRGVVMMARTTWVRWFDDERVTSLGLFLTVGVDASEAVAGLRARAGADEPVVIRSNAALRSASLDVFDRTFAITAVLRALAFAVAFIGVLSALMALQLERGRELGILRANGLTPTQVWTVVTTQTGVLGLAAGLLALPVGLLLAVVMIFVVNRRSFGWTLDMQVGPAVLLQAVALGLVGALLAGLYPAWRMARTSPALALRSE